MDKNTQFIVFSLLGVGIGLAVFGKDKHAPKPDNEKEKDLSNQFPLYPSGEKNILIQLLQKNILAYGLPASAFISTTGGADGIYGSGTRNALRWFGYNPNQITFEQYVALMKKLNKGFQLTDLLA